VSGGIKSGHNVVSDYYTNGKMGRKTDVNSEYIPSSIDKIS